MIHRAPVHDYAMPARHDIDPQRFFTQLLTNLPATPLSQLDAWLPDRWKLNNPSTRD